jgi:hypothetical protein
MKTSQLAICTVATGMLLSTSFATPVQWTIEEGGNGHWYEQVLTTPSTISWSAALAEAESRGGYLVTVTSAGEETFIQSTCTADCESWAGGYLDNGSWGWVTGEIWDYTNWYPGEPNGTPSYSPHLEVLFYCSGWNDATLSNECDSYIVEYESQAGTWTVDDDGKADFDNIQAAIDAAIDGDKILVYPGTYTSTAGEVVDMRGKEIWLHSSAGAEVTIIDGEQTRRGIVCDNQEPSNTIIEGFTITNGYNSNGGGIYCFNSSPSLTDCAFTENTATGGGGMYNNYYSNPTVTNCTFTGNTAIADCGGMANNNNSNPTVTNCTFTGNTANDDGGGMRNTGNSAPTLTNCTFENNTASRGGGMCTRYDSSPTLDGCTFTGNTASDGGGMYTDDSSTTTLTNTTVCGNTPDQIYGDWTDDGGNTILYLCLIGDEDKDGVDDFVDNCYLYNPDQADCNNNGIGDVCDVADTTSPDCDQNGVPDECQSDCDGDGWIDPCDNEGDCDDDGIPDNCELDCNENNIPDDCDILYGISEDCNENGIPDECDLTDETVEDCNENGIPDTCELEDPDNDQNNNGQLDECECVGDADQDGYVNVSDLLEVVGYWNTNAPHADINFDGIVDVSDLLIVIAAWGPCQLDGAVQWTIKEGGNDHWYIVLSGYTWQEAQDYGISLGGHLVTLTSAEENAWVSALSANQGNGYFHIGGFQDTSSPYYSEPLGGWRWVTNEPWEFTNWFGGNPNDNGGENYLQLFSWQWNDQGGEGTGSCILEWSN